MGFEACHPAVNFIFFAAAIYGAVSFKHPVFLAIAYVCAFAYSVKRCGRRAVIFNLCLLPLILAFALYYSSYHHFGVTVLKKNFIPCWPLPLRCPPQGARTQRQRKSRKPRQ